MNRSALFLIVAAAFSLVLPACQTTRSKGPDRFAEADTTRDGRLSLEEVDVYLVTGMFHGRDANRDDEITPQEWAPEADPGQRKVFREVDANRDGVVVLSEALAYGRKKGAPASLMNEADTNKDRYLSRDEVADYYGKREGPL